MARFDPETLPAKAQALALQGATIGLLGGSFNPAHDAHRHISLVAMRRLRLDAVWWLVSPQNPLKPMADMAPLDKRVARARLVAQHPNIHVSAIESAIGTQYTVDTINRVTQLFPRTHFAWLMGGDSMSSLHLWRKWHRIVDHIPIAVVGRPHFTVAALTSTAARHFSASFVSAPSALMNHKSPAWTFILERLDPQSATAIRENGSWL